MELVEVPPDYLKLDIDLIRGIEASSRRQELVQATIQVASDLGIQVIAEGIESSEVADICKAMGCRLGAGVSFWASAVGARLGRQDGFDQDAVVPEGHKIAHLAQSEKRKLAGEDPSSRYRGPNQ